MQPSGYGRVWTSLGASSPVGWAVPLAWGPPASGHQAPAKELLLPPPPLPTVPRLGLLLSTRDLLTPASSLMPPHAWGVTWVDPAAFLPQSPQADGVEWISLGLFPGPHPSVGTDGSICDVSRSLGPRASGEMVVPPALGTELRPGHLRGGPLRLQRGYCCFLLELG